MFSINEYYETDNLEEALSILSEHPDVKIVAGGTDVFVKMRHNPATKTDLFAIRNIKELYGICVDDHKDIHIGAMSTFTQIANDEIILKNIPILAEGALSMGGPQIRNVATIGGNICNGAVSADSAASLFALRAKLHFVSKEGSRIVPVEDAYLGPGRVDVKSGELLKEIIIPQESYADACGHYMKYGMRKAMDIATLGVAVIVKLNGNEITYASCAATVMAPKPVRLRAAEDVLTGATLNSDTINRAKMVSIEDTKARDSWRASKEFREHMLETLFADILDKIAKERGI